MQRSFASEGQLEQAQGEATDLFSAVMRRVASISVLSSIHDRDLSNVQARYPGYHLIMKSFWRLIASPFRDHFYNPCGLIDGYIGGPNISLGPSFEQWDHPI